MQVVVYMYNNRCYTHNVVTGIIFYSMYIHATCKHTQTPHQLLFVNIKYIYTFMYMYMHIVHVTPHHAHVYTCTCITNTYT